MMSKDKLHEYAERPFVKFRLANGTPLSLEQFRSSFQEILEELEVNPLPSNAQMEGLYNKHQHSGKGVGPEEFEGMLFRMLCFMRASQEVEVGKTKTVGGEERDKKGREEFIKKNPQQFKEVYDCAKPLGKGSFGTVYKVTHKAQCGQKNVKRERVCKIISKAVAARAGTSDAKVREELAVLKRLDHPHVLRIFEDFEDNDNFYLITETCRGGDLGEYMKCLEPMSASDYEFWVAKVMQHTLSAVAYCHQRSVIHKDLKPENVMISTEKATPVRDMHIVVVDFGLAEMFSHPTDRSHIVSGTPPYMAPEVWAGNFSKSCDVWSCGIMMFYLLSGTLPFNAQRVEDFARMVAELEPDWARMAGATQEATDICKRMLAKREHMRPTAQAALKDRWFCTTGVTESVGKLMSPKDVEGLMKVGERTQFEKFVTRLVATQVDASQQRKVNETFRAFDTDGDGTLSREELRNGLLELSHGASRRDIDEAVDELDVGRTGRVTYTEFLAGFINLRSKKPEEQDRLLLIAWQQFSPDEDGRVKVSTIQDALATRGMTVADLPDKFMEALSRDATGEISFRDFKQLLSIDSSGNVLGTLSGGKARGAKFLRWIFGKNQ